MAPQTELLTATFLQRDVNLNRITVKDLIRSVQWLWELSANPPCFGTLGYWVEDQETGEEGFLEDCRRSLKDSRQSRVQLDPKVFCKVSLKRKMQGKGKGKQG
eukprot:3174653-Amphidinium_carterae.1